MSNIRQRKVRAALAAATVASTMLAMVGSMTAAHADYAPSTSDVVGVGSDTVQNIGNFVADGDISGDAGFNTGGSVNKLVSFDATPDANDRAGYLNGSVPAGPLKPLNPTIQERAGLTPIQRPNGSGAGITAILADTGTVHAINYVRASRLPKAAEQTTAGDANHNFGFLHVVQVANDPLQMAKATQDCRTACTPITSNAPAGLSVTETVGIYSGTITTWSQLGAGLPATTIIPLLPQPGSGTGTTFLNDLKAANGGVAITLGANVQIVEENDPTSLTKSSSPADTIAPFSGGRLNLYASTPPYFHDPNVAINPPAISSGVVLVTGTAPDGKASYLNNRGLYYIFRQSDLALATPMEPGGTLNWAKTLFSNAGGASPFVALFGQADIAAAGVTPNYSDLGNVSFG